MKTWILAIVLGMIAIAPFLYLAYYTHEEKARVLQPRLHNSLAEVDFHTEITSSNPEEGVVFAVLSCQVIDGYQFMLALEGGGTIEVHLPVATKEAATQVVIDIFNKATPPLPTVKLLRNVGGVYWIADIHLTMDGKRVRLVDLLQEKELTLD